VTNCYRDTLLVISATEAILLTHESIPYLIYINLVMRCNDSYIFQSV